jgi:hypothetical protein
VARAALGQREDDDGTAHRVSGAERDTARRQAAWVIARSVLIGAALAALAWWL